MFERTLSPERPTRELRHFPRVPLVVPVRLRWPGALGLEAEVTETRDTSRGGILVASERERRAGSPVWVTFPFNPDEANCVPEFPARVAYSYFTAASGVRIGIAFGAPHANGASGKSHNGAGQNGNSSLWRRAKRAIFGVEERRLYDRVNVALPVNLRRGDSPWVDQAMSANVSAGGLEFCSRLIYELGENVEAELPKGRWPTSGQRSARVLRVSSDEDSLLQNVAVQFVS